MSLSGRRRAALVAMLLGAVGCRGAEPDRGEPAVEAAAPARSAPGPAAPDTTPLADPCIRGGTPRANVTRIMGEPDSVVYGSWFYGESEVLFGYGVVVEIRDRGELILCDPV